MDKFDQLLGKKGKKVSDLEQRAKKDVLSGFQSDPDDELGGKLAGLKKVSVAAPDEEGLKSGLDKAKDILGQLQDGQDPNSGPENLEAKPKEECSPEELDQKIQMLMEYKRSRQSEE